MKCLPQGTLIVAVKFKDGVVMGSDQRAISSDLNIVLEDVKKIFPLGDKCLIGFAGTAALAQWFYKTLVHAIKDFELKEHKNLSFEGKANLVSFLLLDTFLPLSLNFPFAILLASNNKIYLFDVLGGKYSKDFWAIGAGQDLVASVEQEWVKKPLEERTEELAIETVKKALEIGTKNVSVGPKFEIYCIKEKIEKIEI
jgi:20S proteasome subunit beta 3